MHIMPSLHAKRNCAFINNNNNDNYNGTCLDFNVWTCCQNREFHFHRLYISLLRICVLFGLFLIKRLSKKKLLYCGLYTRSRCRSGFSLRERIDVVLEAGISASVEKYCRQYGGGAQGKEKPRWELLCTLKVISSQILNVKPQLIMTFAFALYTKAAALKTDFSRSSLCAVTNSWA